MVRMYHQGDVGHQRWCACISKYSEIIRGGVHVSPRRHWSSEVVCMYQQTEKVPAPAKN